MSASPTVGVLGLQGDVREHLRVLASLGAEAVGVRRAAELERCDGLVLPGGESTTMVKLARTVGLLEPLRERIAAGLPTFGTCAGMILLADRLLDAAPGQETLGGLDVVVRRNAFGRQVDSFEGVAACAPSWAAAFDFPATFIRAPWVEKVGAGVEVVATVPVGEGEARIVAVREGAVLATSFHPEVTGDDRIHRLFLDLVRGS